MQVRIYVPFQDRFGILTELLTDENKMLYSQAMKITHDLKRETEQLRQYERK